MSTTQTHYDVLVVGAGPAGLATALGAARHGARVLVVERHPSTTIFPRATGVSTRTMEIFRTWGIDDTVRAGSVAVARQAAVGSTLADATPVPSGFPSLRDALAVSPAAPACCPQDHIEPLLAEQVRRFGGDVRFHTELTGLRVGPHDVRATLTDRASGAVRGVRARYVVGADGPRSTVRAALGIAVEHLGNIGEFVQVQFRADLTQVLGTRTHVLYVLEHPAANGIFLPVGAGRWGYVRQWYPEHGESPDLTPARWTELLRIATGVPDLRPDIIDAQPFTMAADLAAAFRSGRGFLVGDAAHRMTPVGGVGMNTAIHDGHNLGWKLAWVVRGLAGDGLLDSYADERRPVAERNAMRSLRAGTIDPADGLPGDIGVGYRSAVIAADTEAAEYALPELATAAPGERAPHVWISHDGRRRSTVDLFDGRLTLLVGRRGRGWLRASTQLRASFPIAALTVGGDIADSHGRLARAYRLADAGAVLVRPDGYVAWRSDTADADPVAALDRALGCVLDRAPDRALDRTPVPALAG